jgi:hypothetical protein
MDRLQAQQLKETLVQVALLECKELAVRFAEIIAHLQKQDHLTALGTLDGIEERIKFLTSVLTRAKTEK